MEYLKLCAKYPCKEVLGKLCWTPTIAARAVGVHRNTILGWARKTKAKELNMPLITPPIPRSRDFIPVREFLDWIGFTDQN